MLPIMPARLKRRASRTRRNDDVGRSAAKVHAGKGARGTLTYENTELQITDFPITMRIVPRFRWTVSSLLLILIYAGFALAAEWTTLEQDLAHKIAAVTGPGAVALNVTNHSSLAQSEVADIERGLRGKLSDLGLALVASDQAAATVQVWLSEDLQNFVWIAQIHQGTNEPSLVMVSAAQ